MVNHATLTLGARGQQHLLDDLRQGGGLALDGTSQGIAAQGSESHAEHLRSLTRLQGHATVIDHDERASASHDRSLGGEVERDDRYSLQSNVLPHIQLGPIRQRKDAEAFALALGGVVETPQLRTLSFRVPSMLAGAEREYPLLGAAL